MCVIGEYVSTKQTPDDFCSQLLGLDKGIRFAGIADKFGKMTMSEYRKGLVPLLSREESILAILQSAIRMGSRKTLQANLGKIVYSMTLYERVVMVTAPLSDHALLMLSFDLKGNHESIIVKRILPLLKKYRLR